MDSAADLPLLGGVAPFGNPRIKACSRLPKAYRSVPRPSSPLGAKASTRCPCFPRPPPATTAATKVDASDRVPGAIPATTTATSAAAVRLSEGRQAYPCQTCAPPQTERRKRSRMTCQHPPYHDAWRDRSLHARTTGTSSPPHDVQGTRPATAEPAKVRGKGPNGVSLRAAGRLGPGHEGPPPRRAA